MRYERKRVHMGAGEPSSLPLLGIREPIRAASASSDVVVPFYQSLITGVLLAVLTAVAAFVWALPWWTPLAVGGMVWVGLWLYLLADHRKSLWRIEEYLDADLNGDGAVGKPQSVTRLMVTVNGTGQIMEAQFPVAPDILVKLARGMIGAERPFSQREWRHLIKDRNEFQEIRDVLMNMGLMAWKDTGNRKLGVMLTPFGVETFTALARGDARAEDVLQS